MDKQDGKFNLTKVDIKDRLFPEEVKIYFDFWFGLVATNCLTIWSMMSNIVNVTVFVRLGLKERVNFTLFCLSCSDFMGAVFVTAMTTGFAGDVYIASSPIEGSSFVIYLTWCRAMFVDISTALTVFIAVERCTCVTRPLHFSSSFIVLHSRVILAIIVVFILANYLPLLASFEFHAVLYQKTNSTIFVLHYPQVNIEIQQYNDFVFGTSLAAICLMSVFVCAVIMYRGLHKSSKVRRSANAFKKNEGSKEAVLSTKETRVVKMILVLASLYMVSAMPQIIFCWARILIPAFAQNDMGNLNVVLMTILSFTAATYGAFSIFIYFNFSQSYRIVLLRLCLFSSQKDSYNRSEHVQHCVIGYK